MATEAVLSFLENHNRPFSINEIQQGVKGEFSKAVIQKELHSLVEEEKVKEKTYSKQKVYCLIQQHDTSAVDLKEAMLEMDREINELALQLNEVSDKLKSSTAEMTELKGKLTFAEALDQKIKLEREMEEIAKQLEKYEGIDTVCPKVKREADKIYENNLNEYKKRKRICMDILNSILENYPKTKKHLFEEIGIETDEEVGFSVHKF